LPGNTSDPKSDSGGKAAGAYTLAEILSQPHTWSASLKFLREGRKLEEIQQQFSGSQPAAPQWLFVGCGSSYYVALSAAASMRMLARQPAWAVAASEVLLYPELVLGPAKNVVAVLISRSGLTSEVLRAAELLKKRGVPTIAVSCAAGQPLEKLTSAAIVMPAVEEQSTVMTRSFTSMLLSLQVLAARVSGNSAFIDALAQMADDAEAALESLPDRVGEFVGSHGFDDYVCLGQGPFYGIACEAALKATEMSVSYAQSFHTLEFRHGPKSIVSPETLLVFLISDTGYEAECELLQEMKALGGTTLAITNRADARVRASADLLVELSLDGPELARLVCYLVPAQLLGLYTGLQKGEDPDRPRNLSRVVVLESEKSKPEHAAL